MNPIINKISDMSGKNRYLSKYGGDVFSCVLIIIIALSIFSYYQLQNNIQSIRDDWEKKKCDPLVMSVSGFIRPSKIQPEKSNIEYTLSNYKDCMGDTTLNILKPITSPFEVIIDGFIRLFKNIKEGGSIIYETVDFLRALVSEIINFFFGIIKMIIKILRDIMAVIGTFFYKALLIFFVGVLMFKASLAAFIGGTAGFIVLLVAFLVVVTGSLYFFGSQVASGIAAIVVFPPNSAWSIPSLIAPGLLWGAFWASVFGVAIWIITVLAQYLAQISSAYSISASRVISDVQNAQQSYGVYR